MCSLATATQAPTWKTLPLQWDDIQCSPGIHGTYPLYSLPPLSVERVCVVCAVLIVRRARCTMAVGGERERGDEEGNIERERENRMGEREKNRSDSLLFVLMIAESSHIYRDLSISIYINIKREYVMKLLSVSLVGFPC